MRLCAGEAEASSASTLAEWSEWGRGDIVSEQEQLNRAILAKCWQGFLQSQTVHFNGLEISVEVAREMLEAAGVDLDFEIENLSDQGTELRKKHESRSIRIVE